jgi:hypothetical protein
MANEFALPSARLMESTDIRDLPDTRCLRRIDQVLAVAEHVDCVAGDEGQADWR